MNKAEVAFILSNLGVMFSLATIGLLIASQIKQNWILYEFVISGTQSTTVFGVPVTISYTFTTTADIGIWNYYFSTVSVFSQQVPGVAEDGTITGTKDSSTSGYFSEEAVKACRALAILATISTFINIVTTIGTLIMTTENDLRLRRSTKPDIIITSTAGFTVFTATLALIVVRTQFKDGMSIDTSFYLAIAANITSALALFMYATTFALTYNIGKRSSITRVLPIKDGKEPIL